MRLVAVIEDPEVGSIGSDVSGIVLPEPSQPLLQGAALAVLLAMGARARRRFHSR